MHTQNFNNFHRSGNFSLAVFNNIHVNDHGSEKIGCESQDGTLEIFFGGFKFFFLKNHEIPGFI